MSDTQKDIIYEMIDLIEYSKTAVKTTKHRIKKSMRNLDFMFSLIKLLLI